LELELGWVKGGFFDDMMHAHGASGWVNWGKEFLTHDWGLAVSEPAVIPKLQNRLLQVLWF
jgi:hypothetical protein